MMKVFKWQTKKQLLIKRELQSQVTQKNTIKYFIKIFVIIIIIIF